MKYFTYISYALDSNSDKPNETIYGSKRKKKEENNEIKEKKTIQRKRNEIVKCNSSAGISSECAVNITNRNIFACYLTGQFNVY